MPKTFRVKLTLDVKANDRGEAIDAVVREVNPTGPQVTARTDAELEVEELLDHVFLLNDNKDNKHITYSPRPNRFWRHRPDDSYS